jgi:hypothetical protein
MQPIVVYTQFIEMYIWTYGFIYSWWPETSAKCILVTGSLQKYVRGGGVKT